MKNISINNGRPRSSKISISIPSFLVLWVALVNWCTLLQTGVKRQEFVWVLIQKDTYFENGQFQIASVQTI